MYKMKPYIILVILIIIINLLTSFLYNYSIFENFFYISKVVLKKTLFFTLYCKLNINYCISEIFYFLTTINIIIAHYFIKFTTHSFLFFLNIISIIFFSIRDPFNFILFTIYQLYGYLYLYINNYEVYNAFDFLSQIQHLNFNANNFNMNPWLIKGIDLNDPNPAAMIRNQFNFYMYTILKNPDLMEYHSWYKYFYSIILLEYINDLALGNLNYSHFPIINFFYKVDYSFICVHVEIIKNFCNGGIYYFYNMYLTYANMIFGPLGPIPLDINNINSDFFDYENDPMTKDFFDEIKRFNEEKNRLKIICFLAYIKRFLKLTPYKSYKYNFNSSYKRFYKVSTPLFVFTQQYINYRLKSYFFSDVVFRAMRQKPSTLSKLLRNFGINIPVDIIFNIIYIYFNKKK